MNIVVKNHKFLIIYGITDWNNLSQEAIQSFKKSKLDIYWKQYRFLYSYIVNCL